jgi:hypothetical protein
MIRRAEKKSLARHIGSCMALLYSLTWALHLFSALYEHGTESTVNTPRIQLTDALQSNPRGQECDPCLPSLCLLTAVSMLCPEELSTQARPAQLSLLSGCHQLLL